MNVYASPVWLPLGELFVGGRGEVGEAVEGGVVCHRAG